MFAATGWLLELAKNEVHFPSRFSYVALGHDTIQFFFLTVFLCPDFKSSGLQSVSDAFVIWASQGLRPNLWAGELRGGADHPHTIRVRSSSDDDECDRAHAQWRAFCLRQRRV